MLLSCLVLAARWTLLFDPAGQNVDGFDSDDAIVVLMANDWHWTPSHLFYFGQDRFGAWPFLAMSLLARVFVWTPEAVALVQVAAVVSGLLLIGRRHGWVVFAVLAAGIGCDKTLAAHFFALQQPYAWQFFALALAWHAVPVGGGWTRARAVGFFFAAFLAIWASPSSVVLLAPMLLAAHGRVLAAILVLSAFFAHSGVRALAVHDGQARYARDYRTPLELDADHLADNAKNVLERAFGESVVLPLALFSVAVAALLSRRQAAASLVTLGVGAAYVTLLIAINWMRLSTYAVRYLVPVWLCAWLALAFALSVMARRGPIRAAVAAAGMAVAMFALAPGPGPLVMLRDRLARLPAGPKLVMGGYWTTYVWAGIDPQVTPVPVDWHWDRLPWLVPRVERFEEAWVSSGPFEAFPCSTWIFARGHVWRRVPPSPELFCRYLRDDLRAAREVDPKLADGSWATFGEGDLALVEEALVFGEDLVADRAPIAAGDRFLRVRAGTTVRGQLHEVRAIAPSPPAAAVSSQVALQWNGRFVAADGALVANRERLGQWETFTVVPLDDGAVGLRAHTGRYVRATPQLLADAAEPEPFSFVPVADGVALWSAAQRRFVSAESAGALPLTARATGAAAWETFSVTSVQPR